MAIASLVLGLIGLVAWCCPLVGLPINITGLVLGIKSKNSPNRGMAIAGIILCIIGLVLTLINAVVGVYLNVTGQNPMLDGLNDGAAPSY